MATPADIAKAIGEARGPIDFLLTFAQKTVVYFIIMEYLLIDTADRAMASDGRVSCFLYGMATLLGAVFIVSESFKKCCKAKVLGENGHSDGTTPSPSTTPTKIE